MDWTFGGDPTLGPHDRRFWNHFGTQPRGRSVIKTSGTWATVDNPRNDQITGADRMVDANGETVPAVFLGGHVAEITAAIQAELVAAGYGAYIEE
jgi:hypothetical protein